MADTTETVASEGTATKKLSAKTLKKSFLIWAYGNLTCFSQEHMQTFGYLCAMLPVVEELYDTEDEQRKALKTYSAFFNTEPQIGTMVVGITAGLEEARANGEPVDDETINGIRAGLMGPLAGLGDSLIVGTLVPILLGIALGLSTDGSPLGAIFYVVVWNVLMAVGMRFAYNQGYQLGGKAVEALVGPKATALRDSIVMVGTMVIGAVAATWVSITTSFEIPGVLVLQDTFDNIYPKLLPLLFTLLCWWLMSKKKIHPTMVMLILVVVAFLGVLVGFFNPGLSY
jgi:mannose/fructose/N-acetylgalactosamine-specific phosphotransferase system component IID